MTKLSDYVYCDFETQSVVGINDPDYIRHATTRAITFVQKTGGRYHLWLNPRVPVVNEVQRYAATLFDTVTREAKGPKLDRSKVYVAHNGEMFDARLVDRFFSPRVRWCDTLHLCRVNGLPGTLKAACEALGLPPKLEGKAVEKMYKAKWHRDAVSYPLGDVETWKELLRYAKNDVVILARLHAKLLRFDVPATEYKVIDAHQTINERGFCIDVAYATRLITLWERLGIDARAKLVKVTKGALTGDDVQSPEKVKACLAGMGLKLHSIDKRVVDRLIDGEKEITGVPPKTALRIREVLELRKLAVRASAGKVAAFMERADENAIVKFWANYHGAGPGRWSGRGCQPHNIPRGHPKLDVDRFDTTAKLTMPAVEKEADRLSTPAQPVSAADVLTSLTRGVIIPRDGKLLGVCDYSAIEARCVAWLASCKRLLDLFNGGGDVYLDFGSELFGRKLTPKDEYQRFLAKQIVLGCGYQMGGPKFEAMCYVYRIDLDKVNLTGKQCVDAYRRAYPEIPYLWNKFQRLCIEAIQKQRACEDVQTGIIFDGSRHDHLAIVLPSGRCLRYWKPEIRMEYPTAFESAKPLPKIYYQSNARGGYEADLYGGKITENISQGIARDILAERMVELERVKLPVVLHVHDEPVCELDRPEDIHKQAAIMSTTPRGSWYETFPLGCEGHTAFRYSKQKPKGSIQVKYHKGKAR